MAFTHYTPVSINSGQVPSTQTDFPVLVSVTDARFKTVGNGGHVQNSNGYDIRPYTSSALTTAITGYELERYNASTGEVVMWVKVASLSSSTTPFVLAYGDASLTTDGSSTTTWSNNFIAVYHLGNGTTLSVADSTGANNGTNSGVTATTGQINGGGSFVNASNQKIYTNYTAVPNYITFSAWIKATSFPADATVMGRFPSSTFANLFTTSGGKLNVFFHTVGTGYVAYNGTGTNTLSTGTWYHVAGVYDSADGKARGYVNGALDGTSSGSGGVLTATETSDGIYIGKSGPGAGTFWDGLIDEARIASVSRTAAWLLTEYNNQSAPGSFITVGSEVAASADVTVNLTGVAASPAIGTVGFNVSMPLGSVAADPQIGIGTVTIEGVVIEPPPIEPGGGTGAGRPARTGMRLRPTEDIRLYLDGVAAKPRVGQVTVLNDVARVYERYSAPIPRAKTQKQPEMPAGMRGLFKKVEKPIPPAVFVYQVGLPKLKAAVGTGKVTAHYEELDEETIMLIDLL